MRAWDDSGIARARKLRREAPVAERLLWGELRAGKLGGLKFRRQVPIDRYIADFACLSARVVVEIDGGSHLEAEDYDHGRTQVIEACGFRVMRFGNRDVLERLAWILDRIRAECRLARLAGD